MQQIILSDDYFLMIMHNLIVSTMKQGIQNDEKAVFVSEINFL